MADTLQSTHLKQVRLGTSLYDISAHYLHSESGTAYTIEDIMAAIEAGFKIIISTDAASTPKGVKWTPAGGSEITGTLEAADADANAIYMVPEDTVVSGSYVEYVVVGTSTPSWEKIGTTTADLSNYVQKGTYTSDTNGAHTHTVSGSVTINKYTASKTKLSASASGATAGANGTASVVTGLGTPTTDSVLGADTTFSTSVIPTTAKIKATAADTTLTAPQTANYVKSYPGVFKKLGVTSVTPCGNNATVSKVTSAGSKTDGSAASWSAAVDNDGILSFSWTTNTPTAVTLPTFASATVATAGTATTVATGSTVATSTSGAGSTIMEGLGTAVTGSAWAGNSSATVVAPEITISTTSDVNGFQVVTGIQSATTTAGTNDLVSAVTALGTPSTATALTGVQITTQPSVTISDGATGDVEVATGLVADTESASFSGTAASAGGHTHTVTLS